MSKYNKISEEEIHKWRDMRAQGMTWSSIARLHRRSTATVRNAMRRAENPRRARRGDRLTLEEVEVLSELLARGMTARSVAQVAGRTEQGVEAAVRLYDQGASRLACAAKELGHWPRSGRFPPDASLADLVGLLEKAPREGAEKALTSEQVRLLSQAARDGATWAELGQVVGHTPDHVRTSVEGWRACTSGLARAAALDGKWVP